MSGAEVKQWKNKLREGARFFGAGWNPNLKGILAPPGTRTAILVQVDPDVSRMHTLLIATHDPKELLAALEGKPAQGGEPVDASTAGLLAN